MSAILSPSRETRTSIVLGLTVEHDLAELMPIECGSCPERSVRAAQWEITWETVGYAIGGSERRSHVCAVCLHDELLYALEMNLGITPPVVTPLHPHAGQVAA